PALGALGGGQRARRSVHPDAQGVAGAMIRLRLRTLRARLLWGTVFVIVPTMAGVFLLVERHQRAAIVEEMQRRGNVMAGSLAAVTLVMLLFGGVSAALVARRISKPVQQLAEGAAGIARGDWNQRIEPPTDDEIGRLAIAFNHMVGELAQQRVALENANTELRRGFE